MKKIIILLFLFQLSFAQTAFDKANQLFQKENYQEAIANYERILASGQQSAEVYFNLGNCYYKLQKIAPSIYNYEKALQLNPDDEEIKTNLNFAQKRIINNLNITPKVGFDKVLQDFADQFHYETWAWISVVFAFLFLAFFASYYFSVAALKKRLFFSAMVLVFVGLAISFSSGISQKNRFTNNKPAIVFAKIASVKNEPKPSSPEKRLLHEGTKVYILESINNWKKVQLTDETTGWISDEAIREL